MNSEHEGGVIAPLIFYSDKTSLSKGGKVSGHPIYLTLGNISCENRYFPEGHCLLAILPDFSTQALTHLQWLEAFQRCLEIVLQPLKKASFEYGKFNSHTSILMYFIICINTFFMNNVVFPF